jgi:hypothetical protein
MCERAASPDRTSEFVIAKYFESNRYRQGNMTVVEHAYRNVQEITLGLCDECFWPAFSKVMKTERKTATIFVTVMLLVSTLLMIPAFVGMKHNW